MRRLFVAIFAVLTLAFGAGTALAANNTWLPAPENITAGGSLYVSPEMQSRLHLDQSAFIQSIADEAAKNNLPFLVVITQQGSDLSSGSKSTWASDILHNVLWNNFQTAGSFDADRTVIVLYVRSKNDDSGSIAVRAGSYLHGLGMGPEHFADANGPVLPAARRFIRSDVQTAIITILANINSEVTSAQASASPAADQSQPTTGTPASDHSSDNPGFVLFMVCGGVGILALIIALIVSASNRRARERRERLASLSSQARAERPSYTPPSSPWPYTPRKRTSSPPPRHSSGSSSSGRRSSGGGIFIGGFPSSGGSHHSSGGSRSSCGSSSSGSSSSSSCGSSSSSSSSCGSSSSSSCGGSSSSCGGGGSV